MQSPFKITQYFELAWRIDSFHYWFLAGLAAMMVAVPKDRPPIFYGLLSAGIVLVAFSTALYIQKMVLFCRLIRNEVLPNEYIKTLIKSDPSWNNALSMGINRWPSPLIISIATLIFLIYMNHLYQSSTYSYEGYTNSVQIEKNSESSTSIDRIDSGATTEDK